MSLLPGQILPPSTPLGHVKEDGTVVIDTNWWLLLYNLCQQILSTQGGLPASALESVESADFDISTSDVPSVTRRIENLSVQLPQEQVIPSLLDVINALVLALNAIETPVPIGSLPATNGGTGQTQYTIGDLLYSAVANSLSRLTGNITTTKKFLTQTGSGSASAAPVWSTISASDLPGSFGGFANPSATIGLSAVNGTAATAMTSDSAPALSQAISPTWSGTHTFSNAITVNGAGSSLKGGVTITGAASAPSLTLGETSSVVTTMVFGAAGGFGTALKLLGSSNAQGKNWLIGNQFNLSDTLEFTPSTANGGSTFSTPAMKLTGSGNLTLSAPASGDTITTTAVSGGNALTVGGTGAGTAVVRVNTQATTGAQTASFAATNKPGAANGSPQKWWPVNADGTTYYIPLFS